MLKKGEKKSKGSHDENFFGSSAKPILNPLSSINQISSNSNELSNLAHLASDRMQYLMHAAHVQDLAIDDCIVIAKSKDFKGWAKDELSISVINDNVPLPLELQEVFNKYKDKIEVEITDNKSYRVIYFSPWFMDRRVIEIRLAPIDFITHYLISHLLDKPVLKTENGKKATIRQKYGYDALLYSISSHPIIPANISIQPIIISKDDQLLLMQRSGHVFYYPNAWSASIEETMQAYPSNDNGFVDGAIRGIKEELGSGLNIGEHDIQILSFCIEYPTLSFDVICVARILSTAEEIKQSWLLDAPDKYEAKRIEFVPHQMDALLKVILEDRIWHPTSRMRIFQLLFHSYGFEATLSAYKSSQLASVHK